MKLSLRALNRALLARQLLLEPSTLSVEDAVEHLCGLQNQLPRSAYFALGARLKDFTPASLSSAIEHKRVVRMALMRSTVHLVTAEDALWMRPTVQSVLEKQFASLPYAKKLKGVDLEKLERAARALIESEPMSMDAMGKALSPQFAGADVESIGVAARMWVAGVQVPPRGMWGKAGAAKLQNLESFLGKKLKRADPKTLVLRYLRAFGPATVADAQVFSGLRGLGEVFVSLKKQLVEFDGGLFDLPDAPRPDEDTPAPPRLLGEFEQPLLSYADRTRILPLEMKARFASPNAILPAALLIDGFVAGTWKMNGKRAEVTLFKKMKKSLLDEEIARIESSLSPRGEG